MDIVFEVIDKTGRKIHLTNERLFHISEHKGMDKYLEDIKNTLTNPDKIVPHDDGELFDYYRYYKHRKSHLKFLMVVVKYLNGKGFVLTSYFVPKIIY